jgi:type I restriction enzyme R subunit
MVIAVDKFTAVKMCDKVQHHWKEEKKRLQGIIRTTANEIEKARLKRILDYMRDAQMAVIISEEAGEEEKFKAQKLAVKPHRDRMNALDEHGHDVEYNFKDPAHPLQLVFVCAMWLTGFDAPTVSTLYLDKPMKDHTLMQTIARANRVTSWQINGVTKRNGEIVDYYNVFRNMKKALKDYAQGQEGLDKPPVQEKAELFRLLNEAIEQGMTFCREREIELAQVMDEQEVFKNIWQFNRFADTLLGNEEWRKSFNVYENTITSLYEAAKPEILGRPVVRQVAVFQYLRGVIDGIIEQTDIDKVSIRIGELLDESVVVENTDKFRAGDLKPEYRIITKGKKWDLSKIDFEKLRNDFKLTQYKNIEIADLRAFVQNKLEQMLQQNVTRADFAQRLQQIIDTYNAGGTTNENYFEELVKQVQGLQAEAERAVREGLTEDELELFDLLKKDTMTKEEEKKVKLAAKALLKRLKQEQPKVLVQDWFKDTQSQKQVRAAVEQVLDKKLPESYDRVLFKVKCDTIFETMLDYANRGLKWAA